MLSTRITISLLLPGQVMTHLVSASVLPIMRCMPEAFPRTVIAMSSESAGTVATVTPSSTKRHMFVGDF
jgi:hypothetical protein